MTDATLSTVVQRVNWSGINQYPPFIEAHPQIVGGTRDDMVTILSDGTDDTYIEAPWGMGPAANTADYPFVADVQTGDTNQDEFLADWPNMTSGTHDRWVDAMAYRVDTAFDIPEGATIRTFGFRAAITATSGPGPVWTEQSVPPILFLVGMPNTQYDVSGQLDDTFRDYTWDLATAPPVVADEGEPPPIAVANPGIWPFASYVPPTSDTPNPEWMFTTKVSKVWMTYTIEGGGGIVLPVYTPSLDGDVGPVGQFFD